MQRSGWIALALLGTFSLAQAEPQAVVSKVNGHNSYTYYNYKKATKSAPAAQAPNYSEVTVTPPPRLEAVPGQAAASPYPTPQSQEVPTYSQNFNSGPSLAANRSGSFSSSIYSLGPNYGPYNGGFYPVPYNGGYYNNACYNNGYYTNGYSTGITVNGYYNNRSGLTVSAGIPGRGYCQPGFQSSGGFTPVYGPGFQSNLTPQRFDPQPGDHPYSIQQPRPR